MPPNLRSETAKVVDLANRDLSRLWRLVAAGASAGEALHDLLPAIIREYGALGGALAAEWYDEQREKAGVPRSFVAVPVAADDRGAHALVGWALKEAADDASLQALILGGVQRRVADHVRYTVAGNSIADPSARGWQRVARPDGCWFCRAIASRGAVFTESTADFASHDHCLCSAVPAWGGKPAPVKPFRPSERGVSEADRARFKKWASENGMR